MKLQIDTINKVISIEDDVKLSDLYDTLNKFFPQETWREFILKTNIINTCIDPIIFPTIPYIPIVPYSPYPWWQPYTTSYNSNSITYKLEQGIYNVQI